MTRLLAIKFTFLAGLCLALCGAILDRAIPWLWQYAPSVSVQLTQAAVPDIAHTLTALAFMMAIYVVVTGIVFPRSRD